jgi:hypothetical protein
LTNAELSLARWIERVVISRVLKRGPVRFDPDRVVKNWTRANVAEADV